MSVERGWRDGGVMKRGRGRVIGVHTLGVDRACVFWRKPIRGERVGEKWRGGYVVCRFLG